MFSMADHALELARFVGDALDVLGFKSQPLKLLVYAYCTGQLSSRKIARAATRKPPYQLLADGQEPHVEQLIELRRGQRGQLESAFRKLFQLGRKLEMASVGRIQLTGSRPPEEQIAFLLERAEQVDRLEEQLASMLTAPMELPYRLLDPELRRRRLEEASRSLQPPPLPASPTAGSASAPDPPAPVAAPAPPAPAPAAVEPAEPPAMRDPVGNAAAAVNAELAIAGKSEPVEEPPPEPVASPSPVAPRRSSSRKKGTPLQGLSLSGLQDAMRRNMSTFVLLGTFLLILGGYSVINALPETPKPARKGAPQLPPRPGNTAMLYVGSALLTAGMLTFVALVALDPAAPRRRRRKRKTHL